MIMKARVPAGEYDCNSVVGEPSFETQVWRACDNLFITTKEAEAAIKKFRKEQGV
jgi:hypothetical protein